MVTKDVAPDPVAMQAELDGLPALIERAEAELAQADEVREVRQAIYDAAGREWSAALAVGTHAPGATWQNRSGNQLEADAERRRAAEAAFRQADEELGAALVARTEAATALGGLRMRRAFLEGQLAQLEAAQERERMAAPAPHRDLLAGIRARLFGDGPDAA